jgi:hypothetical protein
VTEHLISLWVRSDHDPSGVDWQALLPNGVELAHAEVRTFPSADVEHTIMWWITRRLTAEEWGELDDAESEVLARIVGEGFFQGTAGPVPELGTVEERDEDPGGLTLEQLKEALAEGRALVEHFQEIRERVFHALAERRKHPNSVRTVERDPDRLLVDAAALVGYLQLVLDDNERFVAFLLGLEEAGTITRAELELLMGLRKRQGTTSPRTS